MVAESAGDAAAGARRKFRNRPRRLKGAALRPGIDTPLWNSLAIAVRRTFHRRGDKVRLARHLGISRQRLHLLLVARTRCPDAERTLQLLAWLAARQQGVELDR